MTEKVVELKAVGLNVKQSALDIELYVFTMDGKTLAKQLGARQMRWHKPDLKAEGFQRPLDRTRIREIADYLSKNPILPNSLVVAFKKGTLEFRPFPGQASVHTAYGEVTIHGKLMEQNGKVEPMPEQERIGYVIDGQHRLKAIKDCTLAEGTFSVIVSAFHGVDSKFQLGQFYALNQTVPISAAHLALLRRELGLQLPLKEAYKKAISDVCGLLQGKPESPFQPEKHIGSPIYKGPLQITVLESMVERAIKATNLRHRWNQNANDIPASDFAYIAQSLYVFWKGISEVFPRYWGRRPKDQRLFCALGLYTMILFHDKVMEGIDIYAADAVPRVKAKLEPIKDIPWDKMLSIPATVKTFFKPENLFDTVKALWDAGGKRPYNLKIVDPVSAAVVWVNLELPTSS